MVRRAKFQAMRNGVASHELGGGQVMRDGAAGDSHEGLDHGLTEKWNTSRLTNF